MQILDSLSDAPAHYHVLLCDVWGVIHDGARAFPDACAALARWRESRGPVVLISNSPRPRDGVIEQLDALGVPRAAWSAIATSGDATRALLAARAPGPALRIGPPRDEPLYEGLGLDFADVDHTHFISCTGLIEDEVETPDDYRPLLARAAARGLVMICANPDIVVQRGPRLIFCAGALARLYREIGGEVLMAGKPHAPLYELALSEAAALLGRGVEAAEVLAVGDGLATDIAGAAAQGLDALFVAEGIHTEELFEAGQLSAPAAEALLAHHDLTARFAIPRLV
ncbi:MAG TPA: TIGR01459 family HAD-type hydrolase [Caulobacteraceae bacterium]|jgi:HAD superfamily hydrolase (TIGR01459 family)|nr:TIGR01459 family HAD-type hydrolase [Caulobacteraceae bacterium]